MIQLKNEKEIEGIRESGKYLKELFVELSGRIMAGMSTFEVDKIAFEYMKKHKCGAPCLGYYDYPAATCVSVNDTVIHGGFISDSTHTYEIGNVSEDVHLLNVRTEKALYIGIEKAGESGARLHDIAHAIESYINQFGYGIVREYCGHGVGFEMHEDPLIYNYVSPQNTNSKLKKGMVFCIEPMINMGTHKIKELDDGWTVKTADGKPACHWEHTVALTNSGIEILT